MSHERMNGFCENERYTMKCDQRNKITSGHSMSETVRCKELNVTCVEVDLQQWPTIKHTRKVFGFVCMQVNVLRNITRRYMY